MTNILADKAVLASVHIKAWNASRVDQTITNEIHAKHNAKSDAGRYTKHLIDKKHLVDITRASSQARQLLYSTTKPWMDDGARLLPNVLFDEFAAKYRKIEDAFNEAADDFASNYPSYVRESERRLNGMFRREEYPATDKVRGLFKLDRKIMPVPDSDDFRIKIGSNKLNDLKDDVQQRMHDALVQTTQDNMRQIVETVQHMAERLSTFEPPIYKKGKCIKQAENFFKDSLVQNVRDLADLLPAFNFANDPCVNHVTAAIKKLLCKYDAEMLRADPVIRKSVAAAAADIVANVSEFM